MLVREKLTYVSLDVLLHCVKKLPDPETYQKPFCEVLGVKFRLHRVGNLREWVIDASIVVSPSPRSPQ